MEEPSRPKNGSGNSNRLPEGWHQWPTAREVAKRIRCSRQQVYKLERDGELRGVNGVSNGKKIRRFDPDQVAKLEPLDADELDDEDDAELEDLVADERVDVAVLKLAAKMVSEARTMSADSRSAVAKAYESVNEPARMLLKLAVDALGARETRIAELEKTVSLMHDEQRDARRDDREFALYEKQADRDEQRKDQLFQVAAQHAPVVLGQVLETLKKAGGPLAEWMRTAPPEKQAKVIAAIESVITEEPEPDVGSSSSSPEKGEDHGITQPA